MNIKNMVQIAVVIAAFAQNVWAWGTPAKELSRDFQSPPNSVKPSCYWMWFNSTVDKQGITRDLESSGLLGPVQILTSEK